VQRGKPAWFPPRRLERQKSLELSTSTLQGQTYAALPPATP